MTTARARTLAELQSLPLTIDVPTAGEFLGLGRTASYELVRRGKWPTPVIQLGHLLRVPSAALAALLSAQAEPVDPAPLDDDDRLEPRSALAE